jgi:hypothetical protein
MMVWQARERNEWDAAVRRSLDGGASGAGGGPDPFSLADPPTVERILRAAGFAGVAFADVHEPSTTARTWPPPSPGSTASRAPARS